MKKIHEISGLSEEEKQEMIEDAKDIDRKKAFHSARMLSRQINLDDYIDFLSENMHLFPASPTIKITDNFKL